jgi:hypothetical protein
VVKLANLPQLYETKAILPQLDEFCFTTAERNFWIIADELSGERGGQECAREVYINKDTYIHIYI